MATPENIQGVQSFDAVLSQLMREEYATQLDLFGASSNFGMNIVGMAERGSRALGKFAKNLIDQARYRRDPNSTSTRTPIKYAEGLEIDVKVGGGFGPIEIPNSVLAWAGVGTPDAETAVALNELIRQAVESELVDQVYTACSAGVASAQMRYQVPAVADVATLSGLTDAMTLIGDKKDSLTSMVMNSQAFWQLFKESVSNESRLYQISNLSVYDGSSLGLGLKIVVLDAPALNAELSAGEYYNNILFLRQGAINVTQTKSQTALEGSRTGQDNIYSVFQTNYDFNITAMGVNWVGGSAPTDAEIATSANWEQRVTSSKNTGVILGSYGGTQL